jgi:hypothetical protein
MEEKEKIAIKPAKLIDDNGTYKERASIAEIAELWAIEASIDIEKILEGLLNEVMSGRFKYTFPSNCYPAIESATINEQIFRSRILKWCPSIGRFCSEFKVYSSIEKQNIYAAI